MKFASAAVKALFLSNGLAYSRSIFDHQFLQSRDSKMIYMDVQTGSKSKFGGLLPSDIRQDVLESQMTDYGHRSVEELRQKIEEGRSKEHFTDATQLISDDPGMISKDLADYHDVQLFTTMFVGFNQQPFDVLFDTGSNWFWVQSIDCDNCPQPDSFDRTQSDTYMTNNRDITLRYGSGSVTGIISQDVVCLDNEDDQHCVPDFHFVDVTHQSGLSMLKASGLVGLSPRHYEKDADLFVSKMKEGGAINEAIFSMSVAPGDGQSKITFGGYDEEQFATGPIQWHDIDHYTVYWKLPMNEMTINIDGEEWTSGDQVAIIDSGTSFNLMPTPDVKDMIKFIEEQLNVQCTLDVVPICQCGDEGTDAWPDLEYLIDGQKFYLPRDSYLLKERDTCYMKIMHHPKLPFYIMGLNFFHQYYTVFDQENKRLGFAPSIHADERLQELVDDGVQSYFQIANSPNGKQVALAFGGFLFLAIAGFMSVKIMKKNSDKQANLSRKDYKAMNASQLKTPALA